MPDGRRSSIEAVCGRGWSATMTSLNSASTRGCVCLAAARARRRAQYTRWGAIWRWRANSATESPEDRRSSRTRRVSDGDQGVVVVIRVMLARFARDSRWGHRTPTYKLSISRRTRTSDGIVIVPGSIRAAHRARVTQENLPSSRVQGRPYLIRER